MNKHLEGLYKHIGDQMNVPPGTNAKEIVRRMNEEKEEDAVGEVGEPCGAGQEGAGRGLLAEPL